MATRILIIDSDLTFLIRLRKALERAGYEVRAISRPRPALKELDQSSFDAAILDLNIDWVDKAGFVKDVRRRQRDLPIILTGRYPEDPEMVPVLQAQGYLNKPYLAREILPVIERAIEKGFDAEAPPEEEDIFTGVAFGEVPSFEQLMEIALTQSGQIEDEAPLDDNATIGELLTSLYDEDVEQDILGKVSERRGEDVEIADSLSSHIEDTRPHPALLIPDDEFIDTGEIVVTDERAEAEARQREAEFRKEQAAWSEDILEDILSEPTPLPSPPLAPPGDMIPASPVASALRLTQSEQAMRRFLDEVEAWVNRTGDIKVYPLPSWIIPPTPEALAHQKKLLEAIRVQPEEVQEPVTDLNSAPQRDQTQPITLPEIDLYLEPGDTPAVPVSAVKIDEELDALEAAEETEMMPDEDEAVIPEVAHEPDATDVLEEVVTQEPEETESPMPVAEKLEEEPAEPVSVSELLAQEEELIPTPVDEITDAMGIVLDDIEEDVEDELEPEHPAFVEHTPTIDEEAVEEALEGIDVVGHAALRLMEFSLESTARAIILTIEDRVVARSGDLPARTWEEIEDNVFDAWSREGNPSTRIAYPTLDTLGASLIYSINTTRGLKLSMVFPEDTHMGVIRRQASQIKQAMVDFPEEMPVVERPEPTITDTEPEAAQTLPNRPTNLRAPEGLRPSAPTLSKPPERKSGDYVSYACTWILQTRAFDLNQDYANAVGRWIKRMAQTNDWDIHALEIGRAWVNLHLGVPSKTFIGNVMAKMMDETNERLLVMAGYDPKREPSIWSDGYTVSTPGRLFEHDEIARFARFYHDQKLM